VVRASSLHGLGDADGKPVQAGSPHHNYAGTVSVPLSDHSPPAAVATPERHLRRILRKLMLLLIAIVVVLVGGAFIYWWIEPGISLLDSLYNVVMLMTAIGSSRDPTTVAGKWFNIFLSLFSVAMLISVVTQIGQLILRREFITVLSDWRHKHMKNHTIVCGVSHTTHELLNRLPIESLVVLVKTHDEAHRIQRERERHPGPRLRHHVNPGAQTRRRRDRRAAHRSQRKRR